MAHTAVDSFGAHTETSARALAAADIRCARRYLYNVTRHEISVLHAAGVGVCLIAEYDRPPPHPWHPPLDNPETGAEHARGAVARARSVGYPPGGVISLTVDTMVYPGDFERVRHYFDLAYPILNDAGYLVDVYGGSLLIDYLHDRGLADTTWEAAAAAWSSASGRATSRSHPDYVPSRTATLRQLVQQPVYGGVQCDLNVYLRDPVGEWMPDGTVNSHPEEGEDMPIQIAHADATKVPRMTALGLDPTVTDYTFMVFQAAGTIRLLTADEAQYWTQLGNWVRGVAGKPLDTDQGFVEDELFWCGFTLAPREHGEGALTAQSDSTRATVHGEASDTRAAGVADSDITRDLIASQAVSADLVVAVVAALTEHLAETGVNVSISAKDREAIAQRAANLVHADLADDPDPPR